MQQDLIREIAEAIVRDQLLLNWKLYCLILALGTIGGAAGYWLAPYLKKRAETFATKTDMDEVLRQVSLTTKATEEVRTAVNKADWTSREWATIRRLKLEELLSAAYALDQWLDLQQSKWILGKEVDVDGKPLDKIKLFATLYFPDLKPEANAVWTTHLRAHMYILSSSKVISTARQSSDTVGYEAGLEQFQEGWQPFYTAARVDITALETKASNIMAQLAVA